jgi:hypothetical protein
VIEQATYADDRGIERPDRRLRHRGDDDERIGHLFNGFDNVIANLDGRDHYQAGYVKAMRAEFAELVTDLLGGKEKE